MNYASGIPAEVLRPGGDPLTLFSSWEATWKTLIESLEVRFLANRDEHLHFALLSDFLPMPTSRNLPVP